MLINGGCNMENQSKIINTLLNEAGNKIGNLVATIIDVYKTIKWKKIVIEIPTVPEPSHRPRLSGYRVYVPGAARNQRYFNNHVLPKLKGLFITTPCKIDVDIYCQTPKSFNKTQKILAEMGILRPWVNTGDVDNFLKSVLDMIQPNEKRGHIGIMANDCLVMDSNAHKYYSVKPRYILTITYMEKIPVELMKILRLKGDDDI